MSRLSGLRRPKNNIGGVGPNEIGVLAMSLSARSICLRKPQPILIPEGEGCEHTSRSVYENWFENGLTEFIAIGQIAVGIKRTGDTYHRDTHLVFGNPPPLQKKSTFESKNASLVSAPSAGAPGQGHVLGQLAPPVEEVGEPLDRHVRDREQTVERAQGPRGYHGGDGGGCWSGPLSSPPLPRRQGRNPDPHQPTPRLCDGFPESAGVREKILYRFKRSTLPKKFASSFWER